MSYVCKERFQRLDWKEGLYVIIFKKLSIIYVHFCNFVLNNVQLLEIQSWKDITAPSP